jgi:hypothetical protein
LFFPNDFESLPLKIATAKKENDITFFKTVFEGLFASKVQSNYLSEKDCFKVVL